MTVSREKLFEEVWAEPMTKVAARYGVSGSFLARVCRRLKIPCPPRGYWAKKRAELTTEIQRLPDAQPGDELKWDRNGHPRRVPLPSVGNVEPPTQKVELPDPMTRLREAEERTFWDLLRKLNSFHGYWRWQATDARKKHEDEFGVVIHAGETYFSRDCGAGWHEKFKLSKESMKTLLLVLFHNNHELHSLTEALQEEGTKRLRKAIDRVNLG